MIKTLIFMFLLAYSTGYSQLAPSNNMGFDFMGTPGSYIHLNNFKENNPIGYFHFRLKYDEVKGSPYWFPDTLSASLEMNSGNFISKVPIQYDAYSNEIIATQEGVGEFIIDTRYFQSIIVEQNGKIVPFLKIHPDHPKKFVEVLYENENLYFFKDIHVSYNVQEIRVTGLLEEVKRFRKKEVYYILANGELTKVRLKKKEILNAVPYEIRYKLTEYLKKNKYKLNSESDISEALHHAIMANVNRRQPTDPMYLSKTSTVSKSKKKTSTSIQLSPETYVKIQQLATEQNKSVDELIQSFIDSMNEKKQTDKKEH